MIVMSREISPHTKAALKGRRVKSTPKHPKVTAKGKKVEKAFERVIPEPLRGELSIEVMAAIVNAMGDGLVLLDMRGRIVWTNPAFLHMSGYRKEDIVGKRGMDLISKMTGAEETSYFKKVLPRALQGEVLPTVEFTMLSKGRKHIPVMTTVSTVKNGGGNPCAIVAIFKDISERKKIEEAVRESEERDRTLFEESRDAIYITSRNGAFVDFNHSMLTLFGYTREEMVTMNARTLYARPADRRRFQKEIEEKGFVKEYEVRLRKKDGSELLCLLTTTVQRDSTGNVAEYKGIIRDITEQRKEELEFQEVKDRLENVLGATQTHIDVIDESFNLHYVDPSWQKIYGDPEGRKCYEYFMGRDIFCPTCGIPRAFKTRQITVTEEVLPREHNRVIEVHTIPFRNAKGEWLVAEFNIDITERKKAEKETRENEARLAEAQRMAHVGSWEWTIVNDKETWSDETYRIFGLTPREFGATYSAFLNIVHYEDREIVQKAVEAALKDRKSYSIDHRIVWPDGTEHFVHEQADVFFDKNGNPLKMAGTVQDITEKKSMEYALIESEKKYRELIDHSLVGNYITQSHIIKFCNRRFAEIFGFTNPEELIGTHVKEIIAPESWDLVDRQVRLRESGEVKIAQYEFKGKRKDGKIIDLEVLGGRIIYEGKPAIQGTMIDITERKRDDEKLEAIHRMTRELALTLDTTEIAGVTMDMVQEILEFGNCSFALIDEKKRELSVIDYRGFPTQLEHQRLPLSGTGVTIWVVTKGESVLIPDVTKDARYVEWMSDMKSELAVPLKVKEKTIGVINVESETIGAFGEKDVILLETLAAASAVAIQNARLHEEKLKRIEEMTVLDLAFHDIMSKMDLRERLALIVEWAVNLLQAKGGGLYIYIENADELELVVNHRLGDDFTGTRISPHEGLSGKVFSSKIPMIIDDYPSWGGKSEKFEGTKFTAVVGVPIIWKTDVIGVLNVADEGNIRKFTIHDMRLLENFANTAAVMINNARLFDATNQSNTHLEFVTDLMSHDLTNINQVTLGYLELLGDTGLSATQKKYFDNVLYSARRNAKLISNVRRIQLAGESPLAPTDLDGIIRNAKEGLILYPGKSVKITYAPKRCLVYANEFLEDVLRNLLDNAMKFDPSIDVVIDIEVKEEGEKCRIMVADRGRGISDEYKATIFRRLERLEKGMRGTGIGLHLVKTIIDSYGGEVWVEDNKPQGAVFNILLKKVKE
jgi:PAS domain S-box-containing protein